MLLRNSFKIAAAILALLLTGCHESEYSKMVKAEMDSGMINDSLFLGLRLGRPQEEFFTTCWKLNQEKVVSNGDDMFVQYKLPDRDIENKTGDINMLFYGIFDKEVMTGMKLRFNYEAWSLWNEAVQSDKLVLAVKDTMKSWYPGNDFIKVKLDKKDQELWIKVDGNRRITIKPLDDQRVVKAQIDDLRYVLAD